MSLSLLHGETTIGINIDLTTYLASISQVIGDRTDLAFMLKSDKTALDGAAEYSVVEGASLVVNGNVVTAYITTFASLLVGTKYHIGLGIKYAGDLTYREIPLSAASDSIKFTQDVIRA